jgi:thiamine biosynthesis lipoprotein
LDVVRRPVAGGAARLEFRAMGSAVGVVVLGLRGGEALVAAECRALVEELETLLSRFLAASDVGRLNGGGGRPVAVDGRTDWVLREALRLFELTGGACDPVIGALVEAWEAGGGARAGVDGARLRSVEAGSWLLEPGAKVDLGGLAKGYAADAARDLCRERGAAGALVTLGTSSVAVFGAHPGGRPWRVGLRALGGAAGASIGWLELESGALSSSSRTFRGALDPASGQPACSDVGTVSVASASGMVAEAWSTAILVRGSDWAWDRYRAAAGTADAFEAVIQTDDRLLATPGLRPRLHLSLRP